MGELGRPGVSGRGGDGFPKAGKRTSPELLVPFEKNKQPGPRIEELSESERNGERGGVVLWCAGRKGAR